MAVLNPFARSQLKIVEPLQLVRSDFDGWKSSYQLEYRACRSAANVGLLAKQFKVGTPLVVNGKHVVVRSADITLTNGAVDEVTVRVEAVDFAAVLDGLLDREPDRRPMRNDLLGNGTPTAAPRRLVAPGRRILQ